MTTLSNNQMFNLDFSVLDTFSKDLIDNYIINYMTRIIDFLWYVNWKSV